MYGGCGDYIPHYSKDSSWRTQQNDLTRGKYKLEVEYKDKIYKIQDKVEYLNIWLVAVTDCYEEDNTSVTVAGDKYQM